MLWWQVAVATAELMLSVKFYTVGKSRISQCRYSGIPDCRVMYATAASQYNNVKQTARARDGQLNVSEGCRSQNENSVKQTMVSGDDEQFRDIIDVSVKHAIELTHTANTLSALSLSALSSGESTGV